MSLLDGFMETVFKKDGKTFEVVFALQDEESERPDEIRVTAIDKIPLKKHEVFRRDMKDGTFLDYIVVSDPEKMNNYAYVCAKPFTGERTVNILGMEYTIIFKNDEDVCAAMNVNVGGCGGYCSDFAKEIIIANLNACTDSEQEKEELRRRNIRHEIVHAFLNESGLTANANGVDCWSKNEEMVDWFAIQGPKIWKAWQEAGAV